MSRVFGCWTAAVLLLAACGGREVVDDRDPAAPPPDSVNARPVVDWKDAPIAVASNPAGISVVRDVRVARHEGFDRLVIELSEDFLPDYRVAYSSEQPAQCGSGFPITLEGEAVVEIRLEPVRGFTEEGQSTVEHGPRSYDFPAVREAQIACDFEAVFTVVLGVTERTGYRVSTLPNPVRLIVDVRHPEN